MTSIIEDYLRQVEASLRADPDRKRPILDELRGHILDKVDDLARADPLRPREDIERDVLHDFGSPRDLALGYEPEGHLLRNQAGEIVLRFGEAVGRGTRLVVTDIGPRAAKAVGRGTGRVLKWFAIGVSALLVLAVALGIWAFYEVRPVVETLVEQSQPAYDYHESCPATPCNGALPGQVFYVSPDARQVRIEVDAYHWGSDPANGTVRVMVTDPEGATRLDRVFTVTNQSHAGHEARWAPMAGNWTVAYEFADFRGTIRVQTYATSVSWTDL